jgi:hypothetical protein
LKDITEKFIKKILEVVNQNVQGSVKKFQDNKDAECKRTQKQIKELREDFKKQ